MTTVKEGCQEAKQTTITQVMQQVTSLWETSLFLKNPIKKLYM